MAKSETRGYAKPAFRLLTYLMLDKLAEMATLYYGKTVRSRYVADKSTKR
ncbi:hypothetical protein HY003_02715 [Candidatus Saccharibacteria bacterium]|nr:hypothetical protein [Candidatus Saccharibacteria bacterium]MBI3338186.1 hypothetical protein [Candidatus Saccharibacteria bacterium]